MAATYKCYSLGASPSLAVVQEHGPSLRYIGEFASGISIARASVSRSHVGFKVFTALVAAVAGFEPAA